MAEALLKYGTLNKQEVERVIKGEKLNIKLANLENLRTILVNLLPMLNMEDGNYSLNCYVLALPTVGQCFGDELTKIKVLDIYGWGFEAMDEAAMQAYADVLLNWLLPAQDDNGPRCCTCTTALSNALLEKISPAIHQVIFIFIFPK